MYSVLDETKSEKNELETIFIKPEQEAFTYMDKQVHVGSQWLIKDPVLAVIPMNSGIVSTESYGADLMSGNLIFSNENYVKEEINNKDLMQYVNSITNISNSASQFLAEKYQELRNYTITLMLTCIFLVFSIIILCNLYIDWSKKISFVETISGYSFFKRYGTFLLVMVATPLIVWAVMLLFGLSFTYSWPAAALITVSAGLISFFALKRFDRKLTSQTIKS